MLEAVMRIAVFGASGATGRRVVDRALEAGHEVTDPHTAGGAHGIGEIGITGVSAAIANAVFNATGRRIRELPITLDKLL